VHGTRSTQSAPCHTQKLEAGNVWDSIENNVLKYFVPLNCQNPSSLTRSSDRRKGHFWTFDRRTYIILSPASLHSNPRLVRRWALGSWQHK